MLLCSHPLFHEKLIQDLKLKQVVGLDQVTFSYTNTISEIINNENNCSITVLPFALYDTT